MRLAPVGEHAEDAVAADDYPAVGLVRRRVSVIQDTAQVGAGTSPASGVAGLGDGFLGVLDFLVGSCSCRKPRDQIRHTVIVKVVNVFR